MTDSEHEESLRLDTLRTYAILDTPPEADFDRLVRLAARVCRTPIATITLVDARRQWFKAATGLSLRETDRAIAFCAQAIRQPGIFVVGDASADPSFAANPLVRGEPRIRFYAGVPLVNPDGFALGTLAVIDTVPRVLSAEEQDSLQTLAHQTMALLETRRQGLALSRATALQRIAGRAASVGGWLVECDSGRVVWSEEIAAIFDAPNDSGRMTIDEVLASFDPESRASFRAGLQACMLRGEPFDLEVPIVTRKGRHAWVRAIGEAVVDRDGRIVQVAGAIQDSTGRRATEEALRRSEARFRAVANATNDAIWEWDATAGAFWCNEGFAQMFGQPDRDGANGADILLRYVQPDDRERVALALREACSGERAAWRHDYRIRKQDGSVLHVEERGFVVHDDRDRPCRLLGGITDATARRRAVEQIAQQAALLDKAADAVIVRDLDHRIRFWNRSAERIYGWRADEAVGAHAGELIYDEPSQFARATAIVLERGEWSGELAQRRRDGTRLTVEGRWTLIRDELGRPTSVLAINTDISDRRALEEQLRQSQRLEAIGQLTGGIAHDFNNLLTVILGNSELLAEQLASGDAQGQLAMLADMSRAAAQRGAELTQRLLAFARRQALQPRAVRLADVIDGMDGLLRRTLPESIDLEVVRRPCLASAFVDPAQLEAALLNLCLNARDAMPRGGRLTIDTEELRVGAADTGRGPGLEPGHYLVVAVTDTGTGIALPILPRVFEPFFTTKDPGKGTGLGLSMVYGFARQSGGGVTIESEPGRGTRVHLYLPRAQASEPAFERRPDPPVEQTGGEAILVVEDDELVRRHTQRSLAALGYRTIVAPDAARALSILRSDTAIDLLFTDVVMPGGIDGRQLAESALAIRPDLKVLYTSGYAESVLAEKGRLDPGLRLLPKPYRRQDLAQMVRRALDDAPLPEVRPGRLAERQQFVNDTSAGNG